MFSIIHLSFMLFSNMMQSILLMNKLLSAIMAFDNRIMVNLSHMTYQLFMIIEFQLINFTKKFLSGGKTPLPQFQISSNKTFLHTSIFSIYCSNKIREAILKVITSNVFYLRHRNMTVSLSQTTD